MLDAVTTVRPMNATGGFQGSYLLQRTPGPVCIHDRTEAGQPRGGPLVDIIAVHASWRKQKCPRPRVDVDQQMQDLLIIEQAYAANARVIEIASNMIDRLMEI
jgi:flagellar hook-associated protein 1 FlgK